jgi:signal transduction histidine kinase
MRAPAFWAPILLLLLGALFPVISFALIRPEWVTVPPIQVAILLTNVAMLTYFLALYGFRILQVIPVARDLLISRMPYGLIVLDSENRLVDLNPAAQSLLGIAGKLVSPRAAAQALGGWWDRLHPFIGPERFSQDFAVGDLILHVTSLPLLQASGWRMGQVFLVEDVTKARQAQQQEEQTLRSLAALQERERLARELHDSLGQTLAAVHLQASTARLFLAQGQISETDRCLDQIAEISMAAEEDVREYLLGAKTAFSPDHRFFESLRRFVLQFSRQYCLPVQLIVPPQLEGHGLSPAAEVQLMRIIQEALSNIRKHAHAKKAQIIFTDSRSQVEIAIIDDGQGFDSALVAVQQAEGFGLQSMRERAETLDGYLEVISQPGRGTQVLIKLHAKDGYKGEEVER